MVNTPRRYFEKRGTDADPRYQIFQYESDLRSWKTSIERHDQQLHVWTPEVVLALLPILSSMKLKRDSYDSYGIFDVRWRLQLIEMSFSDEIRGYWLYESVISLILGFRGCKEEKKE